MMKSVTLLEAPRIHVIGDSHTVIFKDKPGFVFHENMKCTAYNLVNHESKNGFGKRIAKAARRVKPPDVLLLSAGEIDCRLHVLKASIEKNVPIEAVILVTLQRLMKFMLQLEVKGTHVFVLGIPPAGWQGNVYNIAHYPTREQHAAIYKTFNDMARQMVPWYVDIYSKTSTADGFMQAELAQDECHLGPAVVPVVQAIMNEYITMRKWINEV